MKKVILGLLIGVVAIIGALLWKIYVIDGTLDKDGMIAPAYTEGGDGDITEDLKENDVQERVEFAHVSADTGSDQAETGSVDYKQVYDDILQEMYRIVTDEEYADTLQEDNPAYLGISMARADIDGSEALGYCMEDLNRDGVPELLVGYCGQSDDTPYSHILYAAYTCQDNAPILLYSGWYRNAFYYLGDGRFLNCGSNSAASSFYATYVLKPGESELTCEDYWFSEGIWTVDGEVTIEYYHNTIGEYATDESEKLDISDDEFWQKEDELATGIKQLTLISFTDYGEQKGYQTAGSGSEAEAAVHVQWYADAAQPPKTYDTFVAAEGEYAADALFTTDHVVNSFELFALKVLDITEEGKLVYETETLYSLDRLTPEKPLVVKLSFPGDLRAYGISYEDAEGKGEEHRFSICMSGKDGSLLMSDLDQE